jgi:hypothetical protein
MLRNWNKIRLYLPVYSMSADSGMCIELNRTFYGFLFDEGIFNFAECVFLIYLAGTFAGRIGLTPFRMN